MYIMRKLNGKYVLVLLLPLLLAACQSYKKVPYLQDAEVVLYSTQNEQLYDAKIMPKDLLTIVVSCTSPELAAPFNLTVATQSNVALNYTTTQPVLQQYLVDNEGNINFPVLGEIVSVSAILSCRPFFILIFLLCIKMKHYGFSRKSIWKNLETFP